MLIIIINLNNFLVIVAFKLESDPKVRMLAWTTTPWTLPSNLALCVHPEKTYVKVKGNPFLHNLLKRKGMLT